MSHDTTKPKMPPYVEETLDEHRGCMKLVSDVEACLDRRPDQPAAWLAQLREALESLGFGLRQHFRAEEAGRLFADLAESHPRLSGPLNKLVDEHRLMLAAIEAAIGRADALADPEPFELRELNARVQMLIAQIRRHEAEENELVLRAYWRESGVGD